MQKGGLESRLLWFWSSSLAMDLGKGARGDPGAWASATHMEGQQGGSWLLSLLRSSLGCSGHVGNKAVNGTSWLLSVYVFHSLWPCFSNSFFFLLKKKIPELKKKRSRSISLRVLWFSRRGQYPCEDSVTALRKPVWVALRLPGTRRSHTERRQSQGQFCVINTAKITFLWRLMDIFYLNHVHSI